MNTEIILPLPELKEALPGFNKIIGRKTTLPVLGCVKVSRKADGVVTLEATDLDGHATYTLANNQPGGTVDLLVPLEQLQKAFKLSTNSKLDLAVICEGKTVNLRHFVGGSPVQQPVETVPVSEWPQCPKITVASTPLQPGFGLALKEAMQCCSQDSSRYILRGACLNASNDKAHYIVATDGHSLYAANTFVFPFKEDIIVPDSKFINGSLLDVEPCFVAIQPAPVKPGAKKPAVDAIRHICLQAKQWRFVTREVEGNYPNWRQVVPTVGSDWTHVRLNEPAVQELLKVLPSLPGKDLPYHTVKLRTGDRCLWVDGRGKEDKDWTRIAVHDVVITGKPKEISLDREYLLPALKFGLCELAIDNELAPMICSNAGKKMVIMPVRPEGPATQTATKPPKTETPTPSAATPASTEVQTKAEETKTDMATTKIETIKTPPTETTAVDSPFKLAMQQVDTIRDALKTVLRDLAGVVDTLRIAEKEKKASDKEINEFRDKLREIQGIRI